MSSESIVRLSSRDFDAVLFDLDGVLTKTASVHAAAWKRLFDQFLEKRTAELGEAFVGFDENTDYRKYVDGKPREDGVTDFLESRAIKLPIGTREDEPGMQSVHALGNLKDKYFLEHLSKHGVEPYEPAILLIRTLRSHQIKTVVVSSSNHCEEVLQSAGISELFDARVDGQLMAAEGLAGKPAPDSFLKAAQMLKVTPESGVVVEDAISGVQAGARGGFGLVIGVDRKGNAEELKANGAQIVVNDLAELLAWDFRQPLRPAA